MSFDRWLASLAPSSRSTMALCLALAASGCGEVVFVPSAPTTASGGAGGAGGSGASTGGYTAITSTGQVSAKDHVACAVDATAHVSCWGGSFDKQQSPTPKIVDPTHTYRKVSVSYGGDMMCAVRTDGTLWCTARVPAGVYDPATAIYTVEMVQIGAENDWEDGLIGPGISCGIRSGGKLYCWATHVKDVELVLGEIKLVEGTWKELSTDAARLVALRGDGTLWFTDDTGVFHALQAFNGPVAQVAQGYNFLLVVDASGALFRLTGALDDPGALVPQVSGVAFGGGLAIGLGSCAISVDHRMYCDDFLDEKFDVYHPKSMTLLGGGFSDWTSVAVGEGFACGSRQDSSIWCWGSLDGVDYGVTPTQVHFD